VKLFKRVALTGTSVPLHEQLTDIVRVLVAEGHRELATEVSGVIAISRGDLSDSLQAEFDELLVSLDLVELNPDDSETAEIRAMLALIREVEK
jgi:hypothetical protein